MPEASVTLFLAGDVMTGRGVDQILPHPSPPDLHEPCVTDARDYVRLAEEASGPVPRGVDPAYVWGDALDEWNRVGPAARVVNLETSITRSGAYDTRKSIHYRMHPGNLACLAAARLDACVLANNHVLDFGRDGLLETLDSLRAARIAAVGAGRSLAGAAKPVALPLPGSGRLIVAACAHESSGVPGRWAAGADEPGVNLLPDLTSDTANAVAAAVTAGRRSRDIVMVSIHWGDNWGYEVPPRHIEFAHRLIDRGVDLVHGHSSHHPRPVEIYLGRLILYGCGDFLNDYEGISGYEQYRDDLALMFFPVLDAATGRLTTLHATPLQIRNLRLHRASTADARWLCGTLNRINGRFRVAAAVASDGTLTLEEDRSRVRG